MSRTRRAKSCSISANALAEACAALPVTIPVEVQPALAQYLELLMRWNTVMNLVGARTWQQCLQNLLADSFHLAEFLQSLPLPQSPQTWDLGAGAGLPGIPLRMVWQEGQYYLVEVREKRALFLGTVLAQLQLPATAVFRGKAETFFEQASGSAHVVISRAFMPWPDVLTLVQNYLGPQGRVIFLALEAAPSEALQQLDGGWCVEAQRSYVVGKDQRWLWSIQRSIGV